MAKSSTTTPAEKAAIMKKERIVLTKLLEAATKGDGNTLKTTIDDYLQEHNTMTPVQVLSEFKDAQKRTALHFACQSKPSPSKADNDHADIVSVILNNESWFPNDSEDLSALNALLKQKDQDGLTPIMLAAQQQDPLLAQARVLTLLNKTTTKLGLARSKAGATPLHYAAGAGATLETIDALYHAGPIALNTFSLRGGTPLHWACASSDDCTTTIDALLARGADVNAKNETIPAPLVLAIAAGNDKHGARLLACTQLSSDDVKNFLLPGKDNITLFHMTADTNLVATLAALLERIKGEEKAILSQTNREGQTPLDLAAQEGHVGCVLLLLTKGGDKDPNTTNTVTEDDARVYIENYKQNNNKASTALATEISDNNQTKSAPKSTKTPADATEAIAAENATNVLSSPDPSKDQIDKSLELKKLGNSHFSKKDWCTACDYYTQAIDQNPKEAAFYSNRSACYISLEQLESALTDAVMARTLRPDWTKACYRLAVARLRLGRCEDAAMAAWEGLQLDQQNAELKKLLQKCVLQGRQKYQQSKQEAGGSSSSINKDTASR